MANPNNQPFFPTIDETKIHPEVAQHLRLMYDRFQNHFTAIQNQQKQIASLQQQVKALGGK